MRGLAGEGPCPEAAYLDVLLAGTRVGGRLGCAAEQPWLRFQMHECKPLQVDASKLDEAFELSMRTLRAIGRHLARAVRRHCGHRHPPPMELQRVGNAMMEPCWLSTRHPTERYLRASRRGLCACCFALARWRVSFACLFYAHQHHQHVQAIDLSAQRECLVEPQAALDYFGSCVVQTAHAIGLDLSAPGSHDWIGKTDEEGRYLCVWPPPFQTLLVRDDGKTRRCAGYDPACIEDLLRRLASISLLGECFGVVAVGCTQRAVWGQDVAERRMKLPRPKPPMPGFMQYLEQMIQEGRLRVDLTTDQVPSR